MSDEEETPVKHITAPLPPIVPVPTEEEALLKAAQADLRSAQANLSRLALLTAQVRLMQRKQAQP